MVGARASKARELVCIVSVQKGDVVEWDNRLWVVGEITEAAVCLQVGVDITALYAGQPEDLADIARNILFLTHVDNKQWVSRGQYTLRMRARGSVMDVYWEEKISVW